MRMPHEITIAIVEEPVEETDPSVIATQELKPRHQLQPRKRKRNVCVGDIPVRQRIAEHQVRLRDDVLTDELERLLPRLGLGNVRQQPTDNGVIFAPKQRHVSDHREQVDRRRARLSGEDLTVSNPHPWLLREGGRQVSIDSREHSPRRATQARIALIAGMGESRCRRFAQDDAGPVNQVRVIAARSPKFVELVRIIVLGQQAKEHATSANQWWGFPLPAVFKQAPERGDRAHSGLRAVAIRNLQDGIAPETIPALGDRDLQGRWKRE